MNKGGSVLFQLGEGGEQKFNTNINFLLEQWGIYINNDAVIRTVFYKYFHPKEVCIQNGILNRAINQAAGIPIPGSSGFSIGNSRSSKNSLVFVYPYGASLNVEKPAIPILSSGYISYPLNRPVGAVYASDLGRVCVLGSVHMFQDKWLDKEMNGKLQEILFDWLLHNPKIELNTIDAKNPDVNDYHYLPDTEALANKMKPCLQESEELPRDFTSLFDDKLFKYDVDMVPEAVKLYAVRCFYFY